MTSTKEEVIALIRALPDDATLDEIMAALYLEAKVDAGLKELDEGKGIPHEQVEKRLARRRDR